MKIIDPTLSLTAFPPLHFEASGGRNVLGQDVFKITGDGRLVGELTPLETDNLGTLMLDEHSPCEVQGDGCWRLEMTDAQGHVTHAHLLCLADPPEAPAADLSGELAVWATLTLLWTTTARARQRG